MIIKLIGFFAGFLVSSIIDTSGAMFIESVIFRSAILVTTLEVVSSFVYQLSNKLFKILGQNHCIFGLLNSLNYIKVGLIYGLIVDAFKLGS